MKSGHVPRFRCKLRLVHSVQVHEDANLYNILVYETSILVYEGKCVLRAAMSPDFATPTYPSIPCTRIQVQYTSI